MTAADRGVVRVGLLGTGAVAQVAHIPAYRRLHALELVAICDADANKRRALAERTGVRHTVAAIDDLLALDDVDAVDVCLPNHLHRDAVVRCLEAGRHVLCEKPLALTADEVADIIDAQERTGKVVLVGMNNRYRDDSILLKDFIEDGALGDVLYARAGWVKRRERIHPDAWHYQQSKAGGGVFMDLGIQLLDLVLWLCDHPRPRAVTAALWKRRADIDVEDSAVVTLRADGGLVVSIEVSWSFLLDQDRHELEVYGSEGTALLNPTRIYQRMHGSTVNVTPQGRRGMGNIYMESYEREIAFFGEVVAGRAEAPPLAEQLLLARIVEAIARSAESGREVALDGDGRA